MEDGLDILMHLEGFETESTKKQSDNEDNNTQNSTKGQDNSNG